ncbi:MAG: hypothetical protein KGV44_02805 [Flavobacteriaceae bacterium]|nr:hypothetical protein [Flavobacteriaceae bacterium]
MICWIIPIIVGLLCALLGYLLGRMCASKGVKKCKEKYEKELRELRDAKAKFQKDLDSCRRDLDVCRKQKATPQAFADKKVSFLPFDGNKAKEVFGKKIKENDLTVVEGIGPKIQELFHSFNIKTWKQLSETSEERCREILDTKGDSYRIHNPKTWAEQAKMAYEGRWKELKDWQDILDGGV